MDSVLLCLFIAVLISLLSPLIPPHHISLSVTLFGPMGGSLPHRESSVDWKELFLSLCLPFSLLSLSPSQRAALFRDNCVFVYFLFLSWIIPSCGSLDLCGGEWGKRGEDVCVVVRERNS